MENSEIIKLGEFEVFTSFFISDEDERKAVTLLNMHHFNDEECMHQVNGKFVPKYPEKETKEVTQSYHNLSRGMGKVVIVDFMSDGTIKNPRFKFQ